MFEHGVKWGARCVSLVILTWICGSTFLKIGEQIQTAWTMTWWTAIELSSVFVVLYLLGWLSADKKDT